MHKSKPWLGEPDIWLFISIRRMGAIHLRSNGALFPIFFDNHLLGGEGEQTEIAMPHTAAHLHGPAGSRTLFHRSHAP
jgi:hypothetical protein